MNQLHCQHPYKFVRQILGTYNTYGPKVKLYSYDLEKKTTPDGYYQHPDRKISEIEILVVTDSAFECAMSGFGPNTSCEVGIAAQVGSGSLLHGLGFLPFIDFMGEIPHDRLRDICKNLSADLLLQGFEIYSSGNSYHAYFKRLLSSNDFVRFRSSIRSIPEVDLAWVDASFRQPDGPVLRWTAHTGRKSIVTKI
jgi:hypothetical protein